MQSDGFRLSFTTHSLQEMQKGRKKGLKYSKVMQNKKGKKKTRKKTMVSATTRRVAGLPLECLERSSVHRVQPSEIEEMASNLIFVS